MKHLLYILSFLMIGFSAFGQDHNHNNKWALQANLQHQDLLFDIPFGQLGVFDPVYIRPMYSLEVQRYLKDKKRFRRFFNLQMYFYQNLHHDNALGLQLGYFKERIIYKNFYVFTGIEVGVGSIQHTDIQYKLENGVWVPTENYQPAYSAITFGPRLDIGYRINHGWQPIDIMLKSHLSLRMEDQTGGLPFYGVGLGVRYGF